MALNMQLYVSEKIPGIKALIKQSKQSDYIYDAVLSDGVKTARLFYKVQYLLIQLNP